MTVTLGLLDISLVDHKPEELLTASLAGLRLEFAAGIGPEGSFQRMRVSVQSVQIDDQMFASRWVALFAFRWLGWGCGPRQGSRYLSSSVRVGGRSEVLAGWVHGWGCV